MEITSLLALFIAVLVLAAIPGPGVLLVTARSLSGGFSAGAWTTLGIVTGDYLFIILAIFGLYSLSTALGEFFFIIKLLGAVYLFSMGMCLIFAADSKVQKISGRFLKTRGRLAEYFFTGLATTLSNPKAILFYLSLFPNFVDSSRLELADIVSIFAVTTFAVAGVMLAYALVITHYKSWMHNSPQRSKFVRRCAGGLLMASGSWILARST